MIEKIPIHIRDIIQKGFLALGALVLLLGMIYGIRRGLEDAIPGGAKIHETTQDLFYTEKLRQENLKNEQLIEDIELERDEFQKMDERIDPDYTQMGRDVTDRMMGEKGELLKKETPFERKKEGEMFLETAPDHPKSLPGEPRSSTENKDPQLLDEPATAGPGADQLPEAPAPSRKDELMFQED